MFSHVLLRRLKDKQNREEGNEWQSLSEASPRAAASLAPLPRTPHQQVAGEGPGHPWLAPLRS